VLFTYAVVDGRTGQALAHHAIDYGFSWVEMQEKYLQPWYAKQKAEKLDGLPMRGQMMRASLLKYYRSHQPRHRVTVSTARAFLQSIQFSKAHVVGWSMMSYDLALLSSNFGENIVRPNTNWWSGLNLLWTDVGKHGGLKSEAYGRYQIKGLGSCALERLHQLLIPKGAFARVHHEADIDSLKLKAVLDRLFEILV
jgi:hypothetical protein